MKRCFVRLCFGDAGYCDRLNLYGGCREVVQTRPSNLLSLARSCKVKLLFQGSLELSHQRNDASSGSPHANAKEDRRPSMIFSSQGKTATAQWRLLSIPGFPRECPNAGPCQSHVSHCFDLPRAAIPCHHTLPYLSFFRLCKGTLRLPSPKQLSWTPEATSHSCFEITTPHGQYNPLAN